MIFLVLILILLLAHLFYCAWKRVLNYRLRSSMGLSGPKVNFLFGNMKEIFESEHKDQPMLILNDWRKQFGDIYGYYFGPKLAIFVADLNNIKDILIRNFDCFTDRIPFAVDDPRPLLHNLTTLKGDEWRTIRSSITPALTISRRKQMVHIISQAIDVFMAKMDRYENSRESFDIHKDFQALTLDAIVQCTFNMQLQCQSNNRDAFLLNMQEVFRLLDFRTSRVVKLAFFLPELRTLLSKLRGYSRLNAIMQMMNDYLRKILQNRKQNPVANRVFCIDVLRFLLEQQADQEEESNRRFKLTDDVILSNTYIFLLAGYETISNALAFTVWLLAKHKDVQKRVKDEIEETMSSSDVRANTTMINYEFVSKLSYMDAVFHESLRYFPVVQILRRTCIKNCTIGSINFTPGVEAHIFIPAIHHDPDIWPEPQTFDPDRFQNKSYDPTAWLSFGSGGPRNCIGMGFVKMEYKLVLARLLAEFAIELAPESKDSLDVIENSFLLRPKNGVQVRLVKIDEKRKIGENNHTDELSTAFSNNTC